MIQLLSLIFYKCKTFLKYLMCPVFIYFDSAWLWLFFSSQFIGVLFFQQFFNIFMNTMYFSLLTVWNILFWIFSYFLFLVYIKFQPALKKGSETEKICFVFVLSALVFWQIPAIKSWRCNNTSYKFRPALSCSVLLIWR